MQNKIKENVAKTFENFPNANKVYATSDGQVFLNKNRAELHATPKGRVQEFSREHSVDSDSKKTISLPNAKATVEAIKEVTTLEELSAFENDERKTVIEALEKKKVELISEIEVNPNTAE